MLEKTLPLHGATHPGAGSLAVYRNVAVYTVGGQLHAVDLKTRKDALLGKLSNGIAFAQIDAYGAARRAAGA